MLATHWKLTSCRRGGGGGGGGGLLRRFQRRYGRRLEASTLFQQCFSSSSLTGIGSSSPLANQFEEEQEPSNTGSCEGALELWTWGKGETGQLGLGDEETQRSPRRVKCLSFPSSSSSSASINGLSSRTTATATATATATTFQMLEAEKSLGNSYAGMEAVKREEARGGGGAAADSGCGNLGSGGPDSSSRTMHFSSSSSSAGGKADGNGNGNGNGGVGVGIACGLFHSGVWGNGQLWLWGKGAGGRLGTGSEESHYTPMHVSGLPNVTSAALGGLHSAAIADGGSLYTWGFGGFGALGHGNYSRQMTPKKLVGEEWMENVRHVAAGGSHTAAVSSSGALYTWGRDEGDGRLGHGPGGGADEGSERFPIKVDALPSPVSAVACGGFCTMALTPQGQLWSWGGNSNFELGRGTRKDDWRPKPIPDIESIRVIQVACGGYHSAALTDDGRVLTWGHGGHGQLGHGSLVNGRVPCVVEALANEHVVSVSCGSSWTAAVTESGELYTWGKNRDNQLGVPSLMDVQTTPVAVSFNEGEERSEDAQSSSAQVVCVSAGSTHGMCVVFRTRTARTCNSR